MGNIHIRIEKVVSDLLLFLSLLSGLYDHVVIGDFCLAVITTAVDLLPFFMNFLNDPKTFSAR